MNSTLILLLYLYQFVHFDNGCSTFWHEYNRSCYRIYGITDTYNEARVTCQNQGGHLVIIGDEQENHFIKDLFYLQENVNASNLERAYIGLDDIVEEGAFVWVNGNSLDYVNWRDGCPNNGRGKEDAGTIYGPSTSYYGLWNDVDQTTKQPFICERHKRVIAANALSVRAKSKPATYLDRLPVAVVNVRSVMECLHKCLHRIDCLSSNFWPGNQPHNAICVMNGATTDEAYAVLGKPAESFHDIDVVKWIYLEIAG